MSALTPAEQALLEAVDPARMLARTLEWSAINSGTGNLAGLAQVAALMEQALRALPGEVTYEEPAPVSVIGADGSEIARAHAPHLVLRVRPEAPRRVLLTGHMDTVFPADHPFQQLTWLDDDTINGPGTADMKGGIAILIEALTAFEASPVAERLGYDVMLNSDEETGSLASAALIARLAEGKLAALTYEPSALPDGTLAHARGGTGNFAVVVRGRAAHAGRNPADGRNALVAAADLALQLARLGHPDCPINPARIEGGAANNVVPDLAILHFNIRPRTRAAGEDICNQIRSLLRIIEASHEVSAHLHGAITRPPKPVDERAQRLFELVRDCGARLGQQIGWQPSGGVCDGNNIAACGVPVVDTMGARGGAIHSGSEYLIVPSLSERARLSALVLHRLAVGEAP